MLNPTLLVAPPRIGQDAAHPYRQAIVAPTAVLVADGGDRIIRGGDLHCDSPDRLVCLVLAGKPRWSSEPFHCRRINSPAVAPFHASHQPEGRPLL
jgi:hypothetical protein